MCDSFFGILGRVRQPLPADFELTARDAASHGDEILAQLMLIARDSPDPLAQLCAVKALALSTAPRSGEALRRVCALPREARRPAVGEVLRWPRERIAAECTPRLLGYSMVRRDGERPRDAGGLTGTLATGRDFDRELDDDHDDDLPYDPEEYEDPWDQAEFPDGYWKEMEGLMLQFGDPDWEVEPGEQPRRHAEVVW